MADVYCDQVLGSGADNGTSWVDAYRLLPTALDGTKVVAGDTLWVKNNNSFSGTKTLKGVPAFTNDPPKVFGVKAATTATPPVQSDLIPGLRTGDTTRAYDQTGGNTPPTFTTTVGGADINVNGWFGLIYGLVIRAADNLSIPTVEGVSVWDECELRTGHSETGFFNLGDSDASTPVFIHMKNCKISAGANGTINMAGRISRAIFERCVFDIPGTVIAPGNCVGVFDGCDFTAQSSTIVSKGGGELPLADLNFLNCSIHASSALVSGSILEKFRTKFIHTSSATGKTTGQTFQEVDIITNNGNIVEETTRFRTDGANDGGTGSWSLAFTPGINGTRDNYQGLIGPKMAIEVVGDGTSQTLTVYIANSSASTDYQDDEVWLVAKSPSETGTADYDFYTTQMDLLATPSNVTDDTGSVWGSGANNHQKLTISLSPDYDGIIECWVVFAKNFGASPETLYVDPLPVLT